MIKNMKIKPIADRVVVEPQAAQEKTASGLYIPEAAKERPLQGIVVAVGTGTKDVEMEVKAGDTVLYGKYAGTEISLDGKDYLIMKQNDILAIL
ncbi:Heat shock protein 60 family co-chaperone GroES [Mucinivorans hirudinis]|uniref:Co-chaperonin GroES n=1 Tax=Mucinivorans hirudinis TaxID=1433126 RepID=A0A060RC84_9BACT|nr:Heat shock protein 60 family co-chaperone GroES [Mucinivorans hirudinis]